MESLNHLTFGAGKVKELGIYFRITGIRLLDTTASYRI